jgi:hypothetical protein
MKTKREKLKAISICNYVVTRPMTLAPDTVNEEGIHYQLRFMFKDVKVYVCLFTI